MDAVPRPVRRAGAAGQVIEPRLERNEARPGPLGDARGRRPALVELREPGRPTREIEIDRPVEVGRECDGVLVSDAGVSRRHVRLAPVGDGLAVSDLRSTNGTKVNGTPIKKQHLHDGDEVTVGATRLRYEAQ